MPIAYLYLLEVRMSSNVMKTFLFLNVDCLFQCVMLDFVDKDL